MSKPHDLAVTGGVPRVASAPIHDGQELPSCTVRSTDAGVPVIASGVVGPPEAFYVAGHDHGGPTLGGTGS